ncbi:hypothetical protein L3X38_004060 [Prunus dulcis]|uniref:Uncharacterized protein n=1 Tax=Prunus dulcis TaxID=3755 RepID=A0AAD5F2U6_PRUDU|nr:hypothetical protein L3X38_004060 [Prunus dulcis]
MANTIAINITNLETLTIAKTLHTSTVPNEYQRPPPQQLPPPSDPRPFDEQANTNQWEPQGQGYPNQAPKFPNLGYPNQNPALPSNPIVGLVIWDRIQAIELFPRRSVGSAKVQDLLLREFVAVDIGVKTKVTLRSC